MAKKFYQILLAAVVLATTITTQAQIITTYAGSGSLGYLGDGGPATDATLNYPSDVCLDPAGNLYIADFYNNVVRKVSPAGIITTVAGTGYGAGSAGGGSFGGDGGPATDALLNGPYAVAVDAAGNVLFADGYNHNVRKISPSGTITNFAGNHTAGYSGDGGQATAAALNNPVGLAIDKTGNVYIADDHNHVVRKVTPAGIISTFAGNDTLGYSGDGGPATAAEMNNPIGLAIDSTGNLFIADDINNNIRMVNPAGIISTYVATDTARGYSGDGGPATAAHLFLPRHIGCDRYGNLYISDLANNVIRMVAATGSHTISTFAGIGTYGYTGDNGPATAAEFQSVNGVCVDTSGKVYIADVGNAAIRKVGPMDYTAVNTEPAKGAIGLQLSPNPVTNGTCTINLTAATNEVADITVTDIAGQPIQMARIPTNKPTTLQLNVPAGVYFMKLTVGQQRITKSVVVGE
jgi:sugar lactone lactonase YvrE